MKKRQIQANQSERRGRAALEERKAESDMGTTASTASSMSEKVQFTNGEAEIVTLKFDKGKQVPGRFGDQFMFGLLDGRIMFVEPEVNSAILQTGARAGDTVSICKRSEKQGRTTRTLWDVELLDSATEENEPPDWARQNDDYQVPPPNYASQPASWGGQAEAEPTRAKTTRRKLPQPAARLAPSVEDWEAARQRDYPQPATTETAWSDGQAVANTPAAAPVETRIERPPVAGAQAPETPRANTTDRDQLLRCLISAIDAARMASRYGMEQGQIISFAGEDVRALALSIFIGHQKAGRA